MYVDVVAGMLQGCPVKTLEAEQVALRFSSSFLGASHVLMCGDGGNDVGALKQATSEATWDICHIVLYISYNTGRHIWWSKDAACLIMFDHVWSCLIVFDHVWSCLIMFDHVWSCLIMFDQESRIQFDSRSIGWFLFWTVFVVPCDIYKYLYSMLRVANMLQYVAKITMQYAISDPSHWLQRGWCWFGVAGRLWQCKDLSGDPVEIPWSCGMSSLPCGKFWRWMQH